MNELHIPVPQCTLNENKLESGVGHVSISEWHLQSMAKQDDFGPVVENTCNVIRPPVKVRTQI